MNKSLLTNKSKEQLNKGVEYFFSNSKLEVGSLVIFREKLGKSFTCGYCNGSGIISEIEAEQINDNGDCIPVEVPAPCEYCQTYGYYFQGSGMIEYVGVISKHYKRYQHNCYRNVIDNYDELVMNRDNYQCDEDLTIGYKSQKHSYKIDFKKIKPIHWSDLISWSKLPKPLKENCILEIEDSLGYAKENNGVFRCDGCEVHVGLGTLNYGICDFKLTDVKLSKPPTRDTFVLEIDYEEIE